MSVKNEWLRNCLFCLRYCLYIEYCVCILGYILTKIYKYIYQWIYYKSCLPLEQTLQQANDPNPHICTYRGTREKRHKKWNFNKPFLKIHLNYELK